MSADIPESDWRRFKEVHTKLLERYCSRILEEVAAASRGTEGTAHDRYVKVYGLIKERDKQLASTFDVRRFRVLSRQPGEKMNNGSSPLTL